MSDEFVTIEPEVWKQEKEGDMIEGVLIKKDTNIGPNNSRTYHLEKEGRVIMIWGTTVLDDKMALINVGDYVRITYLGKKQGKKQSPTKIFKVEKKKDFVPTVTHETIGV